MTTIDQAKELLLNNKIDLNFKISYIQLYLEKLQSKPPLFEEKMEWCEEAEALFQKVDCMLIESEKKKEMKIKQSAETKLDILNKYKSMYLLQKNEWFK